MRLIAALLLFLLAAGFAGAAPPPAERYFEPGEIRGALLSPNGEHLAITTSVGSPRVSLVVMELKPGGRMWRSAQFSDADVQGVQWVNNRRLVFGSIDLSRGSAPQDGGPGLYAVNIDGSEPLQLIQRATARVTDIDRRSLTLSARHLLLQVPRVRAGEANNEVLIGEFDEGGLLTHWLNVESGRKRASGHRLPRGTSRVLTTGDGEPRVAVSREERRLTIWWRGAADEAWRPIGEGDTLNRLPFEPHTVDDTGTLYVTQRLGPAGEAVLSRFDFASKAPEPEALVSTPGFDFSGGLILERDSGRAHGIRLITDAPQTIWFSPASKRLQAIADERFPATVNQIDCRRCAAPDALMLVRSFSDQEPGQLWLYRAQPGEGQTTWQPLMTARKNLQRAQQALVSFERIAARDGRELPLWITVPPQGGKGRPLPAVVLVHGGPWVRGGSWSWRPMQQFLASRGYLVIEPEFRGSSGYGQAHFRAGWKQWGQAMQDDVADALLWARQQGLASDRACIAGASYGGYSTLMGLVRHPELYRCGVAWIAVADLELLVKGSWWVEDDLGLARRHTVPEMIGDADKDAEMLAANSPLRQAERIKAPLLLAMGELDRRVPLEHGKRLREAMEKAGNPPEWVVYPGEGHGWALPKHQFDFAERVERFLAQHLR